MHLIHSGYTFSNRGRQYSARPKAPHLTAKKSIPTGENTSAKKQIVRPTLPNNRTPKAWTAMAWPTNIQSKSPDGKFGPAKMMAGWGDCWFLASLEAVANDQEAQTRLTEGIKKIFCGYQVTFKGLPGNSIFISNRELNKCLKENGGDADTRLMQLAAYKFFTKSGNFKSLYLAAMMSEGMNQGAAELCFQIMCSSTGIRDPMTYNPMRDGSASGVAFYMFTGMLPDCLGDPNSMTLQPNDVMRFLNTHLKNDRDGASIVINGLINPLGANVDSQILAIHWDVIRTEIRSKGEMNTEQQAFLKALHKWLETRDLNDLQTLQSAAGNLELEHVNPVQFVTLLVKNQRNMNQDHINLLRSAVQEVLGNGPGYIGFPGDHAGTIEGIDEAAGTFTYSEPGFPTLVHAGELSHLIQAIRSQAVSLAALKQTTEQEDRHRSERAGTSRGRRLRQLHNQVVRDGKIDQAESAPLADLLSMDDGAFRQVYDGDQNGMIEGDELKAVQLRVDRWVEHLELTPIW